jgi:prepilin-type N-terminal cleavage/methylation domain-containing protein
MMDKAMTKSTQLSATSSQRAGTAHGAGARRPGFTLTEVMIVIAIIAILVVVVAWAGARVLGDAKVKQTHSVMNSFKAAMAAYRGTGAGLVAPPHFARTFPLPQYTGYVLLPPTFGPDHTRTDYYRQARSGTWTELTSPTADREITPGTDFPINGIWALPDGTYQSNPDNYQSNGRRVYGIQALYHCLMQEPRSKEILSKMSSSSFARGTKLSDFFPVEVSDYLIGGGAGTTMPHETQAILDAWGRPLYYGQSNGVNNGEAYLQSAGPDGLFGTGDDVFSYKE